MIRSLFFTCFALLGCTVLAAAQPDSAGLQQTVPPFPLNLTFDPAAFSIEPQTGQPPGQQPLSMEGRACEGCPRRSVGKSLFQATVINVFYELANLIRGQDTAKITPKTWWANMEQGWVWDLDDFLVNQVGHPYQGNNYYNAARANGLSFYESAAVTAFGSATWEYFGETNHASLNDFINTTLGGIALGEMFHRVSWMVRDTNATGRGRLWSEIGAMVLDPVTGANRFITGDASRVSDKPAEFVPSSVGGFTAAGALWRGSQERAFDVDRRALPRDGPALRRSEDHREQPDAVRRLLGAPALRRRLGVQRGQGEGAPGGNADRRGQGAVQRAPELRLPEQRRLQHRIAVVRRRLQRAAESVGAKQPVAGWLGGRHGARRDRLPAARPHGDPGGGGARPGEESPGQGVSEGPRYYDYGPGGNFGFAAEFARDGRPWVVFGYEGRHLFSLDGVRANHFLQRTRVDLLLPLRGSLGFGASGEYLKRHTYYQDADRTELRVSLPAASCVLHVEAVVKALSRVALVAIVARARFGRRPDRSSGPFQPGGHWRDSAIEPLVRGRRLLDHPAGRLSDLRGGFPLPSCGQRIRRHRLPRDRPHGRRRRDLHCRS